MTSVPSQQQQSLVTTPSPQLPPPPPPKLHLDDGIRTSTTSTAGTTNVDNSTSSSPSTIPTNPRLLMPSMHDDETISDATTTTTTTTTTKEKRKEKELLEVVTIYDYYEIERLVGEIRTLVPSVSTLTTTTSATTMTTTNTATTTNAIRIAIQLPDELLMDAMELCHEYETALSSISSSPSSPSSSACTTTTTSFNVYVLGDTTYAACCPDIIAAQHISAHFLIHYGHACLSSSSSSSTANQSSSNPMNRNATVPQQSSANYPIVLYSFGKQSISIQQCVDDVMQELLNTVRTSSNTNTNTNTSSENRCDDNTTTTTTTTNHRHRYHATNKNILLLYEVQYAHAMKDLRSSFQKQSRQEPLPQRGIAAPDHTNNSNTNNSYTKYNDIATAATNNEVNLSIKMGRIPQAPSSSSSSQPQPQPVDCRHNNDSRSNNCCATTTSPISVGDSNNSCCGHGNDTRPTTCGDGCTGSNNDTLSTTTTTTTMDSTGTSTTTITALENPSTTTSITGRNRNSDSITEAEDVMPPNLDNEIIKEQYHRIMVGGLELPHPFSSKTNSDTTTTTKSTVDNDDDDEWVYDTSDNSNNEYILLYIGDITSRPFLNIVLRFMSTKNTTTTDGDMQHPHQQQPFTLSSIWTWTPPLPTATSIDQHKDDDERQKTNASDNTRLCTNVLHNSNLFHKILQRRYYLIQKAKQCTTFGIIVAHMTPDVQIFVKSIQHFFDQQQSQQRRDNTETTSAVEVGVLSYYTFVVGKINPAKLANFPEIQCFVLVACPEHTLLHNERELYPIPIITPYELLVAFGSSSKTGRHTNSQHQMEWGDIPYSTYPNDFWDMTSAIADLSMTRDCETINDRIDGLKAKENHEDDDDDDDNDDAPYFSLVTGKYETRTKSVIPLSASTPTAITSLTQRVNYIESDDVTTLSTRTDGAMVQYVTSNHNRNNAASKFLQRREYQGLVVMSPNENNEQEQSDADNHDNNDSNNTNSVVQPAILGRTGIASKYGSR